MTGADIVRMAASQIGVKESPFGSNRQKYGVWYGWNGVAWCDIFVSWVAAQVGAGGIVGKYAYCPSHVAYFQKRGWWRPASYQPVLGDIIFFGAKGKACHVGIVERRINAALVQTIEGNTSAASQDNGGCVMRRARKYGNPYGKWGILGFAHPAYDGKTVTNVVRNWLQVGDKGPAVSTLQKKLIAAGYSCGKAGADGDFGSGTQAAVKAFQKAHGLTVDGEAGVLTVAKLNAILGAKPAPRPASKRRYDAWVTALQKECNQQGFSRQTVDGEPGPTTLAGCPTLRKGAKGQITKLMQQRLIALGFPCGRSGADGDFGIGTRNAVIAFQRAKGLAADGIVGKNTWRKLLGL